MTRFVLATANSHKASEIRAVLEPLGYTLLERPAHVGEVEETEATLEGNALLKARALVAATADPALADDTGLFVDYLQGRPGVHSARYAGEHATFADNVAKLLSELDAVPAALRGASFRTVIAVAYPDGSEFWVEGVLAGRIIESPRGAGGFGYDPVFVPDGADGRTLAELNGEDKNALSHRGLALRALAKGLVK
ncbi:MAG TPA: RdgB/HAM1 family non-canonical purine NTP pyrophosphatase [Acidimicrobiales bacterium]|nr:RdgB/HAM1 family non-canonical purine NTP pyrophosphatase [Acidimicrobiales bacterium]